MGTGFVYKWIYTLTDEYYIGIHKGTVDDGYIGSGSRFRKKWALTNPDQWKREILFEGDYLECGKVEKTLVTKETIKDPLCLNMAVGGISGYKVAGYLSRPYSYRTKPQEVTVNGKTYPTRIKAIKDLNITFKELDEILINSGWSINCKYNQYNRY